MLCPEDKRLSAKQVLEHPFLTSAFKRHASIDSNDNNLSFKLKNMKEYKESSLMQRIVYTALSQRLSYAEIDNLQNIFIEMDKDCDGEISKKEFSEGIQSLKLMDQNSEEIQKLFKIMDFICGQICLLKSTPYLFIFSLSNSMDILLPPKTFS